MAVSTPFILRPIATSLLGVAVMLGGGLGYWLLPVSSLPQVDFPTVQVTTQLPGASPDTIGANDQILAADAYRDITVAYGNGAPVCASRQTTVEIGSRRRICRPMYRRSGWRCS